MVIKNTLKLIVCIVDFIKGESVLELL